MKDMLHALRPVGGALLLCAVVAGCSEPITSTPSRSLSPATATSARVAVPMSDQHIIMLRGEAPADLAERVAARGGRLVRILPEIGVAQTSGLTDADAERIVPGAAVAHDFFGRWVPSPEEMITANALLPSALETASLHEPLTADLLALQWNMFQIRAPEAWSRGYNGDLRVRVAILDSGLDPDHQDQRGLIDVASSIAYVSSTDAGGPDWADDHYHGTYVGGLVTSNNIRVAGVAPDVTLIAVKVLNKDGSGSIIDTILGIIHAANVGAQVINMSLGVDLPKDDKAANVIKMVMNRAINYAHSRGAVVVSASGNLGLDLQHANAFSSLPCEAGVQFCVSATARGNFFATYSNYGTNAIDVSAPGGDGANPLNWVLGLCSSHTMDPSLAGCRIKEGETVGKGYIFAAGTSSAAPHVSGLAALLYSQFGGTVNPSQVMALIEQNATDLGKPGADAFFGKGQIDVFRTLTAAAPIP